MQFTRSKSGRLLTTVREAPDTLLMDFWGGECGFQIRALSCDAEEEIRIYPHNPYGAEDGGVEYARILYSRPKSPVLKYALDSWGLNWFYQPKLTSIEKDLGRYRPEHVVGSYAAYHKTKGGFVESSGPNYKTGKTCHLYRGWVEDARGWRVWTNYQLNLLTGILSQRMPEVFWREAKLPWRVDPTFGYTTIGASTAGGAANPIGCKFTASEAGDMSKITCYFNLASSGNAHGGLYSDSSATPNTLLAESGDTSVSTTISWVDMTAAYSFTAVTLWLAIGISQDATYAYDSGSANQLSERIIGHGSCPPLPNPYAATGYLARQMSIYATYTAAAGDSTPPFFRSPDRRRDSGWIAY